MGNMVEVEAFPLLVNVACCHRDVSFDTHPWQTPLPSHGFDYLVGRDGWPAPGVRVQRCLNCAAYETVQYLDARVKKANLEGKPGVLLSGGVDSLLLAACLVRAGVQPVAVTVAVGESNSESSRAVRAAKLLGLDHIVVNPQQEVLKETVVDVMGVLKVSDPWEVAYGVLLRLSVGALVAENVDGTIWMGSGADVLLAGGEPAMGVAELDARVRGKVSSTWEKERFIPDHPQRVVGVGNADRITAAWRTRSAFEMTSRWHPNILWGNVGGRILDKMPLRVAATKLGLPESLFISGKSPAQDSSGIFDAFTLFARQYACGLPGAGVYTDPKVEDLRLVTARLWMSTMFQHKQLNDDGGE